MLDSRDVERCVDLANEVTWASEVMVHVNSANLGCGRGVYSALEWFFSYEEEGIVLEDDIFPGPSFLDFSSTLLKRYRHDERVAAVSGCCLIPPNEQSFPRLPYRFSRVPHVWGWAAWRSTWADYVFDMSDWRNLIEASAIWEATQQSVAATLYWGFVFDCIRRGSLDTWDAQWVMAAFRTGRVFATSNTNLTENRGFGPGATHTRRSKWTPPKAEEMKGSLEEVPIVWDRRADRWVHAQHLQVKSQLSRALLDDDPYFASFREEIRGLARKV